MFESLKLRTFESLVIFFIMYILRAWLKVIIHVLFDY